MAAPEFTAEAAAEALAGDEARRSTIRSVALVVVVVAVLALPAVQPVVGSYNYVMQLATVALMWVAMSSSWNIIGGYAGYISLGHNVFYGVGGYVAGLALVYWDISPFVSMVFAGLVAMVFGLVAGLITWRAKGPSFIVATIAMLFVISLLMDNWELVGESSGMSLPLPPFSVTWIKVPFYYAMVFSAFGAVYLSYRVAHSKFGLGLRALSQDETKAEVAGIDTRWYKVIAFGLSAFFIGTAGATWGYSLSYLRPTIFFTIGVAAQMVLMAIIGGRATVAGPVIGALLIVGINEFSIVRFGATELNIVVTGGILLAVLLFFPLGIVGSLREAGRLPAFLDWD
jgi:branched-chain amino acid transport system permease protein